jgi:transcriptional regulator with XRE-family HTH domain
MSTTQPIMGNEFFNVAPTLKVDFPNELSSALGRSHSLFDTQRQPIGGVASYSLPEEWNDPEYRQGVVEATVENLIAWGVRSNREARGLTQAQLAERMGTKQSAISKLEDVEGGDVLVSTLTKAAHALDLALLVKFVNHAEFAAATKDVTTEALTAESFQSLRARLSGALHSKA